MEANKRQVGGEHYMVHPNGISHWDYCVQAQVPYLEGCASKYVSRWRKKNGLQDLEKAVHYIEKRIESVHKKEWSFSSVRRKDGLFNRFINDNKIPLRERNVIDNIMHWRRLDQLHEAHATLCEMIREYHEPVQSVNVTAFVDDAPCDYNPNQDR